MPRSFASSSFFANVTARLTMAPADTRTCATSLASSSLASSRSFKRQSLPTARLWARTLSDSMAVLRFCSARIASERTSTSPLPSSPASDSLTSVLATDRDIGHARSYCANAFFIVVTR